MPRQLTAGTSAQDRRKQAAADREANATKKFRVKAGQTVTIGEDRDGDTVMVQYSAGEEVDLTDAQAKAMPWAIETGERRARGGQTSRMKQRMQQLQAENERLKADAEARKNAEKDPGRKAAAESLKARGDNFMARGEPQAGSVPLDVLDDYDRRLMGDEFGFGVTEPALASDDELAGGMHGVARGTAGAEGGRSGATGSQPGATGTGNAAESSPFNRNPGESQKPGEGGGGGTQ